MPPIFHEDIASVKKLKLQLTALKKSYTKMGEESVENLKKMRAELVKLDKVTKQQVEDARRLAEERKKQTKAERELAKAEKALEKEMAALNREGDRRAKAMEKEQRLSRLANATLKKEANTIRELKDRAIALRRVLDQQKFGTKRFKELQKELGVTNTKLKSLDKTVNQHSRNVGNYGTALNGVRMKFLAFSAAAAGTIAIIRKWVNKQAELSDAMADVRKTTGLTWIEVNKLNKELLKINTRTGQKELLDLAFIAGKLGVTGVENVLGFARAADKIGVALGRDLGDVEEAARTLGKLTELFNIREDFGLEDAMVRVGSAINALGMASTASESQIVEFTKRLGGIANQARISIEDVMGLGAALDQLGQSPEMSATAISQIIVKLFQNTEKFARVAGLEVKAFSRLLQTDANEALLQFIEALSGDEGGLSRAAQLFDQLGIDGRRAIGVLSSLGTSMDTVREAQALSNEEFEKGTSLLEEYNIKNESLAASIDKTSKAFSKLFQSPTMEKLLKGFFDFLSWSIGDYGNEIDQLNTNIENLADFQGEFWEKRRAALIAERDLLLADYQGEMGSPTPSPGISGAAAGASRGTITFKPTQEELKRLAKLKKERIKVEKEFFEFRKNLGLLTVRDLYQAEIKAMEESINYAKLSEEEKQQALLEIKLKYADKYDDERMKKMTQLGTSAAIGGGIIGDTNKSGNLSKTLQGDFPSEIIPGFEAEEVIDPDAWQETFAEISQYAQLFGGAMMEVFNMISQAQQAALQEDMSALQNRYLFEEGLLNEQLRKKTINENQFNAKKIQLDQKRNREEEKLRKEAAKKQQQTQLTRLVSII